MKSKPNPFACVSPALAVIAVLGIAQSLQAAALTWDSNTGDSGAQDGSGTWTTAAGGWWNGITNVNWASSDTATFGAGTDAAPPAIYNITLGGAITTAAGNSTTGGIHFANSGYTLSNTADANVYSITVGTTSTDGFLTVAAGKSATIGANATVQSASSKTMNIGGGGTLYVQDGGTIRNPTAGNNLLNIIGGTTVNVGTNGMLLATNNQLVIGTGAGGSGTLVVDGGTVTNGTSGSTTSSSAQNIVLSNSSTGSTSGILTINSGSVTNNGVGRASGGESGLRFGTTTSGGTTTAVVNLNGGVLTVARVYENASSSVDSTFNFNGGTLKVTTGAGNAANFLSGLNNAYIKEGSGSGGAIIDTNGVATTIAQALQHGGSSATDGGLTKTGSGTLTLTGNNTYTGATTINTGTLTVGTGGTLGASAAALKVNNNNTGAGNAVILNLATAVDTVTGSLSGTISTPSSGTNTATINNGGSGRNFTVNQTTNGTFAGVISGAGSFTLGASSIATLTLSGASTYTGGTTIQGGTLQIANMSDSTTSGALGAAPGSATPANIVLDGGTLEAFSGGLSLTLNANRGIALGAGGGTLKNSLFNNLFYNGIIADQGGTAGGLTIASSAANNQTILGGQSTYTGGTTVSGMVALAADSVGSPGSLTSGPLGVGTVNLAGGNMRATNAGNRTLGNALTISGDTTFTTAGATDKSLTFAGDATILGTSRTLTVNTVVNNSGADGYVTFGGTIGDAGNSLGLTKAGSGILVLSGTNIYTGATTVNDGTLIIDGSISTSITSVNDGGTLSGTGTVGALNINDGGTLAIGSSPGTLNIGGDLTLALGSISDFEINAFTAGNYDLALAALVGSQTVSFNGGTLNLLFQPGFNTEGAVKIFDFDVYDGTGFTTVRSSGLASGFTASFDATNGIVTVVPEPNAAALIASFGLLALLRRHRCA